ncbi:hypothetical protein GCM10010981_04690 [Dyella nitratireducens]|uniref:Uncharacterized protein n=1 Tax=Dyella nitratireducens TaxID=1849580 RepID=A0ABQ1FK96_9GAMM|nr:hypothetical protein GCM10010981_04690 [Dyella nitratireducens]GLQ44469.1 hypothetical protein GCM10007902_43190 [Dyella nitratireducens]
MASDAPCPELGEDACTVSSAMKALLSKGLPRLCLLDDEYKQVLLKAEIKWLAV